MSQSSPGKMMIGATGKSTQMIHYGLHGAWTVNGEREIRVVVVACQPTGKVKLPCSSEVGVVNCPQCKVSKQYLEATRR